MLVVRGKKTPFTAMSWSCNDPAHKQADADSRLLTRAQALER